MANIRQRKNGTWEITIRRSILDKPIHATADTEEEARRYAARIEAQLDGGIVPDEFLALTRANWSVRRWLDEYARTAHPSPSDRRLLPVVIKDIGNLELSKVNAGTLGKYIDTLKSRRLTPGSVKKRVGTLARALDIAVHREIIPVNPVRQLPRNFAGYTEADGAPVIDAIRDRRLEPGEEERIRAVLADDPHWTLLFTLALETAMRMSEIYTLHVEQIDTIRRTIFLDKTKNGDKRQVPLSSVALAALVNRPAKGLLLPYFDGDRRRTTTRLSYQWRMITLKAECHDLRYHDLRHEATCRLFERTNLSDLQISLITGHRDPRMLRRYANLRGSDLADKLW